jgi:hypothetical protein
VGTVIGNLPLPELLVEAVSGGGAGPRIGRVAGLLDGVQCAALIDVARRRGLRPSGVGDGGARSSVRTSQGVFLDRLPGVGDAPPNLELRERAAALLGLPSADYFEPTHVLKYRPGERYLPHRDTITSERGLRGGGQRFASLVVSLNAPPEHDEAARGGGTRFPRALRGDHNDSAVVLRPPAGGAVLFYLERQRVGGGLEPDPAALHEGLPTAGWTRFVAVLWAHHHPYVLPDDDEAEGGHPSPTPAVLI